MALGPQDPSEGQSVIIVSVPPVEVSPTPDPIGGGDDSMPTDEPLAPDTAAKPSSASLASVPVSTSGFSCCQKATLPLATAGLISIYASLLSQPVVYISVFGVNPSVMGVVSVIGTVVDIVCSPYFGRWCDEGRFNVLCFKDMKVWGRRAPLALFSLPLLAWAFWTNWIGPEKLNGQIELGLWLLMVRLLLAVALGGMMLTANNCAFTELFPNLHERVNMGAFKGLGTAVGTIIGAGVITTAAISMEDEAGSQEQQKLFMSIAVFSMVCILVNVPWCLLMSKSVMVEATERESMMTTFKYVWGSSSSVRMLALSLFFGAGSSTTVLSLFTFFLRQCFGFTKKEAAFGQTICLGMVTLMFIVGFPLGSFLQKRYHPATVIVRVGVITEIVYVGSGLLSLHLKEKVGLVVFILGIGMGLKGLHAALVLSGRQILLAMVVDEDQVRQWELEKAKGGTEENASLTVRRDGSFQAFVFTAIAVGRLMVGVGQIMMGLAGYEAERDQDNIPQPDAVRHLLLVLVLAVCPVLNIIHLLVMWSFPLKGENLKRVETEYAALFKVKHKRKSEIIPAEVSAHNRRLSWPQPA